METFEGIIIHETNEGLVYLELSESQKYLLCLNNLGLAETLEQFLEMRINDGVKVRVTGEVYYHPVCETIVFAPDGIQLT